MLRKISAGMVLFALMISGCATPRNPWGEVQRPRTWTETAPPKTRSIGNYSAGCLDGAVRLASGGPGFQAVRQGRNRHFGHPALIRFLTEVSAEAAALGYTLRIADLSQPRGGPTTTGHASHQTGLDADLWLWQTAGEIDGENTEAPLAVNYSTLRPEPRIWNQASIDVLKLVVERPEVERIFINPVLKRELCLMPERPKWLRKLRPWWGHDRHVHVRLACPEAEALCAKTKDPIPPGDGCDGTLNWWFSEEAKLIGEASEPKPKKVPELPAECAAILSAP